MKKEIMMMTDEAQAKQDDLVQKTDSAETIREAMYALGLDPSVTLMDLARFWALRVAGIPEALLDKPIGEWTEEDIIAMDRLDAATYVRFQQV